MKNITDIMNDADSLKAETALGSVTPNRVGSIVFDTLQYINEAQIFADALIQKVYATEDAFNNDTERLSDLTGKPMKAGSIIYIRSNDTFYRYDGGNTKTVLKENALDQLLSVKADKDGVYPDLTAGDLAGRGESVPAEFGFRASGGKSIKDGRAYIKRIKGNSVVWNQLFDTHSSDKSRYENGVHIVDNRDGSYTIWTDEGGATKTGAYIIANTHSFNYSGHKLLITGCDDAKAGFGLNDAYSNSLNTVFNNNSITTAKADGNVSFSIYIAAGVVIPKTTWKPRIIDLTQMFQAGNEPTTIEDFNARVATLGVDMNAYNEGQVIHCNTESIKSVGDNAWDEEWEVGSVDINTGANNVSSSQIRCKEPICIIGGATYYAICSVGGLWITFFDKDGKIIEKPSHSGATAGNAILARKDLSVVFTAPQNAVTMKFYTETSYGTTYNHDIMISLVHSGWKQDTDAGYQPYWQDTLPLPIIRKYFPDGMKKAGTAHDEIRYNKASGKWEKVQRIGSVDMGSLAWEYLISNSYFFIPRSEVIRIGMAYNPSASIPSNVISRMYNAAPTYNMDALDKVMSGPFETSFSGQFRIKDTSYTDAATFKAALQGIILYYELAEPIVTELDAEDQNFRDYYNVADFGTEQSQSEVPSANFSADIIYQFNAVDMIREHEIEINQLQQMVATMQVQIDSLINNTEAEEQ